MSTKEQMVDLTCCYEICAAHQLRREELSDQKNQEIYGHCARLHGHQYRLEITVSGIINPETGMVINGYEMDRLVREKIIQRMDHHFLNEIDPFFKKHPTTAEWITIWVFDQLKDLFLPQAHLKRVRIYETPTLYVERCA